MLRSSQPPPPPFGLRPAPAFPLPALAALAGRSALGGARETVLACLMGARLARALLPPQPAPLDARRARARGVQAWLATLTLPPPVRAALSTVAEASALDAPTAAAAALVDALRSLARAAADALDEPAAAELLSTAAALAPPDDAPHEPPGGAPA